MAYSASVLSKMLLIVGGLLLATEGCYSPGDATSEATEADPDEITGANAVARTLTVQGYVYVEPTASAATILEAVRRQTRTMFGPLRNLRIGLDDREVRSVDPQTFRRENVSVVDVDHRGVAARPMVRVRYSYSDRAVVTTDLASRRSIATTALFSNYAPYASDVIRDCTDDPEAEEFGASGLWYMFNPAVSRCQRLVRAEVAAIDADSRRLTDRATQVSTREVSRRFLPVTATLRTIRQPTTPRYPEYDRLFGARDVNKTDLNVYAFFGVIGEREDDVTDEGYLEMMHVLQQLLRTYPGLRIVGTEPAGNVLDVRVNNAVVPNATLANVVQWAITGRVPSNFSSSSVRTAIATLWRRRAVQVQLPMTVTSGSTTHPLNLNVFVYYGDEGSAWSADAHERYVRAWRDADVFIYSGHSHLGSGPLDPANYRMSDFPDRYQIMMINSCVSYNYYNTDFYALHPGGTRNLDMIVNGTEALGDNGHAVSALILGLVNGRQQNYLELMQSMVATVSSLGLYQYDPLRVADGELDNTYRPSRTPITLRAAR